MARKNQGAKKLAKTAGFAAGAKKVGGKMFKLGMFAAAGAAAVKTLGGRKR